MRVEAGCFYGETGAKRNEDILPIARPSGLGVKRGWRKRYKKRRRAKVAGCLPQRVFLELWFLF